MPVSVSYPGVYINEIPSGNVTITGVATSITAFVGRAAMGPTNEPTTCFSFADFESFFGGRGYNYPMSYAVEDFFLNGGGEAIIVRVEAAPPVSTPAATTPPATTSGTTTPAATTSGTTTSATTPTATTPPSATAPAAATPAAVAAAATAVLGGWTLEAASNGSWGNALTATVDKQGLTDAVAKIYKSTLANSFNLTLTYTKPDNTKVQERYTALNIDDTPYRLDRVLAQQSNLAIVQGADQPTFSAPTSIPTLSSLDAKNNPIPVVFANGVDGGPLSDKDIIGDQQQRTGLFALEHQDLFNLLCIPWDQRGQDLDSTVHVAAANYCVTRRAMYIIDSPQAWANAAVKGQISTIDPTSLGAFDEDQQRNSIVYFPKVKKADLEMGNKIDVFPACGIIAGQIARTDTTRGVWKAPAGTAVGLAGIDNLEFNLTDNQQGLLNPLGINCLRNFRVLGPLVWGARTLRGADLMADDYKYVPVRRLTLYIEESLHRGTKWAVFEPNDETLWSALRLSVGNFMADLSRQGAFYGYQVRCDKTTTTQNDINLGICNVVVAFAPVKPAEFIILNIQQQAGQMAS